MSIAKSADDEKAQILEALTKMRDELDTAGARVDERAAETGEMRASADAEKARAAEAARDVDGVIVTRNQTSALLNAADETQHQTEREFASAEKDFERMAARLGKAADEEADFVRRLGSDALSYEGKLAEAYEGHRSGVERKSWEIKEMDEEVLQGQQAMQQWRSQWEEELTEKNSIDAELLTLRSEFEKSSATYDREIEGLKDCLEKGTLTLTLTQP